MVEVHVIFAADDALGSKLLSLGQKADAAQLAGV